MTTVAIGLSRLTDRVWTCICDTGETHVVPPLRGMHSMHEHSMVLAYAFIKMPFAVQACAPDETASPDIVRASGRSDTVSEHVAWLSAPVGFARFCGGG